MQICNIYYEVNEDTYDNNCYTKEFLKYHIICILYVDYIVDYMVLYFYIDIWVLLRKKPEI